MRGANEQGGEAEAGSSHGACTLAEHVAAVQYQCDAMEQFMRRLRELDATHQQRTADLLTAVSCFASVLHEAFGNAATSYVAGEVPACRKGDRGITGPARLWPRFGGWRARPVRDYADKETELRIKGKGT